MPAHTVQFTADLVRRSSRAFSAMARWCRPCPGAAGFCDPSPRHGVEGTIAQPAASPGPSSEQWRGGWRAGAATTTGGTIPALCSLVSLTSTPPGLADRHEQCRLHRHIYLVSAPTLATRPQPCCLPASRYPLSSSTRAASPSLIPSFFDSLFPPPCSQEIAGHEEMVGQYESYKSFTMPGWAAGWGGQMRVALLEVVGCCLWAAGIYWCGFLSPVLHAALAGCTAWWREWIFSGGSWAPHQPHEPPNLVLTDCLGWCLCCPFADLWGFPVTILSLITLLWPAAPSSTSCLPAPTSTFTSRRKRQAACHCWPSHHISLARGGELPASTGRSFQSVHLAKGRMSGCCLPPPRLPACTPTPQPMQHRACCTLCHMRCMRHTSHSCCGAEGPPSDMRCMRHTSAFVLWCRRIAG